MARITINDCLTKVNNHFELVLISAVRAKELLSGKSPNIAREGSTVGVVALREVAEGVIDINKFKAMLPLIFSNEEGNIEASNNLVNLGESNTRESDSGKLLVIEETDGKDLLSSD